MTDQEKLVIDENQRINKHEAIKNEMREEVHQEIVREADRVEGKDRAKLAAVGQQLREKAVYEVAETETELERARGAARVSQIIDYAFYLVYGLISLEIVLDLAGAWRGNAFRQFVAAINAPLLAPFKSLMPDPAAGRFQFRISYLVALIVYILLHLAVTGLLRMIAHRKVTV